ncbi:hypothetical protein EON64_16290 [archaeon]|nr:MAG: hypothetical protein EON64_16290 [archaeon]
MESHTAIEKKRLSEVELRQAVRDFVLSSGHKQPASAKEIVAKRIKSGVSSVLTSLSSMGSMISGVASKSSKIGPREDDKMESMLQAAITKSLKKGMSLIPSNADGAAEGAAGGGEGDDYEARHRLSSSSDCSLFGSPFDTPVTNGRKRLNSAPVAPAPPVAEEDGPGTPGVADGQTFSRSSSSSNSSRGVEAIEEKGGEASEKLASNKVRFAMQDEEIGMHVEEMEEMGEDGYSTTHTYPLTRTADDIEAQTRAAFNNYVHLEAAHATAQDTTQLETEANSQPSIQASKQLPAQLPTTQLPGVTQVRVGGHRRRSSVIQNVAVTIGTMFTHKHAGGMGDIFWFSSPTLYFTTIQVHAVYLSTVHSFRAVPHGSISFSHSATVSVHRTVAGALQCHAC